MSRGIEERGYKPSERRDANVKIGKKIDAELLMEAKNTFFWRSTYPGEKEKDPTLTAEAFYIKYQGDLERAMGV